MEYYICCVRYLLLIPVIAIFFSNVPLKMEMNMPVQETESCCPEETQEKMSCHPQPETPPESPEDDCCAKKETTCVCFCCFQLVTPIHTLSKFRFAGNDNRLVYGLYQHPSWKNPLLEGPPQPPDMI